MPTDYLLIDFENITPDLIPHLSENQTVLIFVGSKQEKFNRDLVLSTHKLGKQIEWVEINGNGKNVLDFHIACYLGKYWEKEPTASLTVLSNDKGFDPLIKYLSSKGIKCNRIDNISKFIKPQTTPKSTNRNIGQIVENLKKHFLNEGIKLRPKKASKFIAFIKSQGNFDDGFVNLVVDKMSSDNLVEIKDDKITYRF